MFKKVIFALVLSVILTASTVIQPFMVIENVKAAEPGISVGDLVDERFSLPVPAGARVPQLISGWDVDCKGGDFNVGYAHWFKLKDISNTDKVSMKRKFTSQTAGKIILEYRFRALSFQNATWELRNLDTYAIKINIDTVGNISCYTSSGGETVMQPYNKDTEYGVKVVADISSRKADIYINGVLKASQIDFCNSLTSLNSIYISTGSSTTGDLYLSGIKITKGYLVYDQFLGCKEGNVPADWTTGGSGGTIGIYENRCDTFPDVYSLKMEDTSTTGALTLARTFLPQTGKIVFEFSFMLPTSGDGYRMEVRSGSTSGPVIETYNGSLCYIDVSGTKQAIQSYNSSLWYSVKEVCDVANGRADIYINGKLKITNASFNHTVTSLDQVYFSTPVSASGVLWLDDFKVYPYQEDPVDYVPAPTAASHSGAYIGVQSCPLWRAGSHGGWDYINQVPYNVDRKPLLGWYEDGNRETADWEIKWMSEHGIDFNMYCWYIPVDVDNVPLKRSQMDSALHDGFFNAKYSNSSKFAIGWINSSTNRCLNSSYFRNTIVPYWMEYYFKDPRYMVIDNKPVIGIFSFGQLLKDFGSQANVKAEMDYLRQQCINAGFSGAYILISTTSTVKSSLDSVYDAGLDYAFAYSYVSHDINQMENIMLGQRDSGSSLGVVPTLSMGWDVSAWGGPPGGWVSESDFQSLATWAKDTFMPSLPSGSLGRKLALVDNWNEYGEGHFIMPTEGLGFRYLDVIRNTWTGGSHADSVPTEAQKTRINTLYPRSWNLAENKTASSNSAMFSGKGADKSVDGNGSTYAQSTTVTPWDLTVDLGEQTKFNKVLFKPNSINYAVNYTIDVSNDAINWTSVAAETNGNGTVKTYYFPSVTARYVKLNVTSTNGSYGHAIHEFEVYDTGFQIPDMTAFSNTAMLSGHGADKVLDDRTDTYAQSTTVTPWDLTVDLGLPTKIDRVIFKPNSINYASNYTIDVSNDNTNWTTVATDLNGNGTAKTYTFAAQEARYVKLNVTATQGSYGHAVHEFQVYSTEYPTRGKIIIMSDEPLEGSTAAQAIDKNVTTGAQAVDNVPWDLTVDRRYATAFNKIVVRPDATNYATQYTIDVSNDYENWTTIATETGGNGTVKTYTFATVKARYVRLNVTATTGTKAHKVLEFDIYEADNLAEGKTASSSASMISGYGANKAVDTDYYTAAQSTSNVPWDLTVDFGTSIEIDRVKVVPDGANFVEKYTIDVSNDNINWTTKATGWKGENLLFDKVNARYLRLNTNTAYSQSSSWGHAITEFQAYNSDSPQILKAWDFDTVGDKEHWYAVQRVSNFVSVQGSLQGTITGQDPYIKSSDGLGLNIDNYKKIRILLKNSCSDTSARIYFVTDSDTTWNAAKSKVVTVTANDTGYTEYVYDMTNVPGWTGTLKQLRFDPADAGATSGSFSIGYIRIEK